MLGGGGGGGGGGGSGDALKSVQPLSWKAIQLADCSNSDKWTGWGPKQIQAGKQPTSQVRFGHKINSLKTMTAALNARASA
eukprot:1157593-Pelagomonas_calceolata.AAC.6